MTARAASAKVFPEMRYPSVALSVPFSKLNLFMEQLGLAAAEEVAAIEPYKGLFVEKAREFAGYFHDIFININDTRKLIEQLENPQTLKNAWENWFRTVFTLEMDENFMAYLWRIGMRHVEVNLDQRYANLGFSMVRKFCGRIIQAQVPAEDQMKVYIAIDRILDFCLLTETSAYIDATSRCDVEIIRGIADRIRNPITVIGGNLRRIRRVLDINDPSYCLVEDIIAQSSRCETMVADIGTYVELSQKEAYTVKMSLPDLIRLVLDELSAKTKAAGVEIEMRIDPVTTSIDADPPDIKIAFHQLIENAIEAAAESPKPRITIASEPYRAPFNAVKVTIFNTGTPPRPEEVERIFSLFYSTKPGGSGLGLPIASLAIKKSFGRLAIEPAADGARAVIVLPKG